MRWGVAILAAAAAACGGDPFTASLPTDGGASDTSNADGSIDAGTGDGSVGDGGVSESGVVEGGRADATPCAMACPAGFKCVGTVCIDDAAGHFSPTQNPSGNWTYGWTAQLASTFTPYLLHSAVQTTLEVWDTTPGSLMPSVFLNAGNGSTVYSGTFMMAAGSLGLHPGATNEHSVVRWTAPAAGRYAIDALFTGLSGVGGSPLSTVSVTVLINGSVALGKTINTNGGSNSVPFVQAHNQLNAGGVVDFIVDYGNDGDAMDDATGLRATLTTE